MLYKLYSLKLRPAAVTIFFMFQIMFNFFHTASASAQDAPPQLVPRKVIVVPFVNTNQNDSYKYLETTISEAAIDALQKTKAFEIILLQNEPSSDRKNDDYEKHSLERAKSHQADVVVLGSFAVANNNIRIQARALEVDSQRLVTSQTRSSGVSGSIFQVIDSLAADLAGEMKEQLPPVPQKIIMRGSTLDLTWKTLLAPGWGHWSVDLQRGYIYGGLWLTTGSLFAYSAYDYSRKQDAYINAKSGFDSKYDDYNSAGKFRGYMSYAFISVYVAALADIYLFARPSNSSNTAETAMLKAPCFFMSYLPENNDLSINFAFTAQISLIEDY